MITSGAGEFRPCKAWPGTMWRMTETAETRIEVLRFAGCPNGQPALELARRIANEHGDDVEVTDILVAEADVASRRFLGSPSIRVNGRDVDPSARDRTDYHYGCRIYETRAGRAGLPLDAWIKTAIQETL